MSVESRLWFQGTTWTFNNTYLNITIILPREYKHDINNAELLVKRRTSFWQRVLDWTHLRHKIYWWYDTKVTTCMWFTSMSLSCVLGQLNIIHNFCFLVACLHAMLNYWFESASWFTYFKYVSKPNHIWHLLKTLRLGESYEIITIYADKVYFPRPALTRMTVHMQIRYVPQYPHWLVLRYICK